MTHASGGVEAGLQRSFECTSVQGGVGFVQHHPCLQEEMEPGSGAVHCVSCIDLGEGAAACPDHIARGLLRHAVGEMGFSADALELTDAQRAMM